MRALFPLVTLVLLASACATTPGPRSTEAALGIDPEVHGHRGARSIFPESSSEAFSHAMEQGADVLELDTVVTADDQVVVLHDPVLNPALCGRMDGEPMPETPVVVRELSLAELQAFHCTRLLLDRFPRQQQIDPRPIPTLAQIVDGVLAAGHPRASSIHFNVETKLDPRAPDLSPDPATFARLLLEVFRERALLDRLIVQSFDPRTLVAAADLAPGVRRAILLAAPPDDVVLAARQARASIVSPYHVWLMPEHVQAIHEAGLTVVPWTANTVAQWQQLMLLGVDGIITDDPAGLIDWLGERR